MKYNKTALMMNINFLYVFFCFVPTTVQHNYYNTLVLFYLYRELKEQKTLQDCLWTALQIRNDPSQSALSVLQNQGYVLTLDYLLKMLSVHERQQCGMPVVISGETGVGKTFLLETLSKLYNHSYQQSLSLWREYLMEYLKQQLRSLIASPDEVCTIVYSNWKTAEQFEDMLLSLFDAVKQKFLERVLSWFCKMQKERNISNVFPLIQFFPVSREIPSLFDAEVRNTAKNSYSVPM